MTSSGEPDPVEVLGSRLNHLLRLLDDGVTALHTGLGLVDLRPRYTPVLRVLAAGPRTIRQLAGAIGVTHSAASQTVAQMAHRDLVVLTVGDDARHRVVALTPRARSLLPALDTEAMATAAAVRALDAELRYPLSRLVDEAVEALRRRSMRERIAETAAARPARRSP